MKKFYFLLATIMLSICASAQRWDGTVAASYAGGDGKETNPYLIETPGQRVGSTYHGIVIRNGKKLIQR